MNDYSIKRRTFLAGVLGASLGSGVLGSLAFADDTEKLSDEGFTPLFDGKSLKGWHTNPEKIFHGTGGNEQQFTSLVEQ